MTPACPTGPEWDKLIDEIGKFEAYRDYLENDGKIRTPEEVKDKIANRVYQGTSGKQDTREFNYYASSPEEAKDYGPNVSEANLDTTDYLIKKVDPQKYYDEINKFQKESGLRFDVLDNSPEGLKTQEKFFRYLKSKGYKGLDLRGGEDSSYAISFDKKTNNRITEVKQDVISKFKREIGLNKKEVSPNKMIDLKKEIKLYNAKNGTSYFVPFTQVGQSNTWRAGDVENRAKITPDQQLSMFYRPDGTPDMRAINKDYAQGVITTMMSNFADRLGVNYRVVTPEEARQVTLSRPIGNQWNGEPAFYNGDTVYFVGDNITPEILMHEFSHPLIRAIRASNSDLFNNLYSKITETSEGAKAKADTLGLYTTGHEEFTENDPLFKEEVMVRALQDRASNQAGEVKDSGGFLQAIKNLLYHIKQILRKLFGQHIKVEDLDVNTSLDELAIMLKGDTFELPHEKISESDLIAYARQQKNEAEDIRKLDDKTRVMLSNKIYDAASKHLENLVKNKDYAGMLEILAEGMGGNMLASIKRDVKKYHSMLESRIEELNKDLKHVDQQVNGITRSFFKLSDVSLIMSRDMQEIANGNLNQAAMRKLTQYNQYIDYWHEVLEHADDALISNGVGPQEPIRTLISDIQKAFKDGIKESKRAQLGYSLETIRETLKPTAEKIDEDYDKVMRLYKEKNAPESTIRRTTDLYNQVRLSSYTDANGKLVDPIKESLLGQRGEANAVSAYLEAFMYSESPIIGGAALYIKNHFTDVNTNFQKQYNDVMRDLNPLLKAAGVNSFKAQVIGKTISFIDTVPSYDPKTVEFTKKEIPVFLNEHKDYRYKIAEMQKNVLAAKEKANNTRLDTDIDAYAELDSNLRKHLRTYMWQRFSSEYYKAEAILDNPIGRKGRVKVDNLRDEIRELQQAVSDPGIENETTSDIKELQRKLAQLYSLVDDFGKLKSKDELEEAKMLKQYREVSSKLREWKPIPNAFNEAYLSQQQLLINQGLEKDTDAFNTNMQAWVDKNIITKLTDEYYATTGDIYKRIQEIKDSLPKNDPLLEDVDKAWQVIRESMIGFKDEDNQPNGDEMNPERIASVKEAQETINKTRAKILRTAGITEEEADTLEQLLSKSKEERTPSEKQQIAEIIQKKKSKAKLSDLALAQLTGLYARLGELQSKQATDYYVNHMNNWLTTLDTKTLHSSIGSKTVDVNTADFAISKVIASDLLSQGNDAFNTWFNANHIEKSEWDPITKTQQKKWERLYIWNVTRPFDDKYYEKTNIFDHENNIISTIKGAPSKRYFFSEVKQEHTSPRIIGTTIDGKGNWLPKTLAQGAPSDSPYINQAYYDLQKEDPKMFALLEKIKEHYLASQEGLQNSSKAYLDHPRYRMGQFERARGLTPGEVQETMAGWGQGIHDFFSNIANDTSTETTNYDPNISLIKTDLVDSQNAKLPITGLANIDKDQVSMNSISGVLRYMLSAERQRKLLEIQPALKALQDTLRDVDMGGIKDLNKLNKNSMVNTLAKKFLNKKGESVATKAITFLINREVYGQINTGIFANSHVLNKISSGLFHVAALGSFAYNIPSAVILSSDLLFQNAMISAAGVDCDGVNFTRGMTWAMKVTGQQSAELYNMNTKSLGIQIADTFDFSQGRFEQHIPMNAVRSLTTDVLNMSTAMMPREYMLLNATYGMGAGMMMFKKIDQVVDGVSRKINYLDAWELVNGQIQLKSGIDPTYGIGGAEFKKFRNRIHMVNNDAFGNFAKIDQPAAWSDLIYKSIAFMRRHLTAMFTHRFAGTRINVGHGRLTEGYYRTNVKSLGKIIEGFRNNRNYFKYATPQEKQAFLKLAAEAMQLALLYMIVSVFLGWDENDQDRYNKLKAESGPVPLPGVKPTPGRDFDFFGYSHAHAILAGLNILNQNEQWLNPKQFIQPLDLKSIAVGPTLDQYTNMMQDIYYAATGNDHGYYQKEVGPYYWQDAESSKFWNHFGKTFGLSGTEVDPVLALKNFESMQTRK